MSEWTLRPASADDLEPMLALADERRREYEVFQPVFWRPAPEAAARQRSYFTSLIVDPSVITLVAISDEKLAGFVIGHLVPEPAVYAPGGLTCSVDDFTVDHPASWATIGVELLHAVEDEARQRGATQLVVVCGHLDEAKRGTAVDWQLPLSGGWLP